jgi:hypothetical protein
MSNEGTRTRGDESESSSTGVEKGNAEPCGICGEPRLQTPCEHCGME